MKAPRRTGWLGLVALLVIGCAGPTDTTAATADRGYVAADGAIVTTAVSDRATAPHIAGDGLDGQSVDSAAYAGQVLVYNVWAS